MRNIKSEETEELCEDKWNEIRIWTKDKIVGLLDRFSLYSNCLRFGADLAHEPACVLQGAGPKDVIWDTQFSAKSTCRLSMTTARL